MIGPLFSEFPTTLENKIDLQDKTSEEVSNSAKIQTSIK